MEKNYCKKCGMCCKAICVAYSRNNLKISAKNGSESAMFMIKHWHRITRSEALVINPKLKTWRVSKRQYFYSCECFNYKESICNVHGCSPHVCSAYPFYDMKKLPSTYVFYTDDCGFNLPELKELRK
jgi:Fe-S-cluster containining protein